MAKKYEPLGAFLANARAEVTEVTLSFAQIEQLLGDALPASAHEWRPWWGNQTDTSNRPQARAWLAAGWEVDYVNQQAEWVRFRRR